MGGGSMRSEETGQLSGKTRGTKGDGRNERRRQMGGGGVRRGNATNRRTARGLEGQDEWPESSVNTADGSLMVRYGATAPQRQWMARRLLDGEGQRDGSSTGGIARRLLDCEGLRATAPRRQGTAQARLQWTESTTAMSGNGQRNGK